MPKRYVLDMFPYRFWHKVLFDRGYVSTREPFQRLINQGMILSITYRDRTGRVIPYTKIAFGEGAPRHAETDEVLEGATEKMSKARGNVIPVDVPLEAHGADVTRLYEMFMGPLEDTKPWSMQGVEGVSRFLARAWRLVIDEGAETMRLHPALSDDPPTEAQQRVLHKTIKSVTEDMEVLRFNTAISRLMEFVNAFTGETRRPRAVLEPFVLMLAPLAPHMAEELWQALGHAGSLAYVPWPTYDEALTRDATDRGAGADRRQGTQPAHAAGRRRSGGDRVGGARGSAGEGAAVGRTPKKVVVVPGRLVNIVG